MPTTPFDYTWRITYADGEVVTQYNDDGSENTFDLERFKTARMVEWLSAHGASNYSIEYEHGQKPILFRRTYAAIGVGSVRIAYCIGYETNQDGRIVDKMLMYIQPPFAFDVRVREGGQPATKRLSFDGAVQTFVGRNAGEQQTALEDWLKEHGRLG